MLAPSRVWGYREGRKSKGHTPSLGERRRMQAAFAIRATSGRCQKSWSVTLRHFDFRSRPPPFRRPALRRRWFRTCPSPFHCNFFQGDAQPVRSSADRIYRAVQNLRNSSLTGSGEYHTPKLFLIGFRPGSRGTMTCHFSPQSLDPRSARSGARFCILPDVGKARRALLTGRRV